MASGVYIIDRNSKNAPPPELPATQYDPSHALVGASVIAPPKPKPVAPRHIRIAAACFEWHDQQSLQAAINRHTCVTVASGTWPLHERVTIPPHHNITGTSAAKSILMASAPWKFNGYEAVLQSGNPQGNVHISNVTVNANNLATDAVGYAGVTVSNSLIENARCNGVAIIGQKFKLINSTVTGNGASCPTAPPGAGIYVQGRSAVNKDLAPFIDSNTITNNFGPGLDVNVAFRGVFERNVVAKNAGWAAVSLYGAQQWNVSYNKISQPDTVVTTPYQNYCNSNLAAGPGSAALFLCQNSAIPTVGNVAASNDLSGRYGILSIGADELQPDMVPGSDTFVGNKTGGSVTGCADDRNSDLSDHWVRNQCGTKVTIF